MDKEKLVSFIFLEWTNSGIRNAPGRPASKLIYLWLYALCIKREVKFVTGDVKTLSRLIGLSDKLFSQGVEELRARKLLKRQTHRTSLGAKSFKYIPIPQCAAHNEKLHPFTATQIEPILENRLTHLNLSVAQRCLLLAFIAISEGVDLVTDFHLANLSRLSGVPQRSVLANLRKLADKQVICSKSFLRTKTVKWCFQAIPLPLTPYKPSVYAVQINAMQSEVERLVNQSSIFSATVLDKFQDDLDSEAQSYLQNLMTKLETSDLLPLLQAKLEVIACHIINHQKTALTSSLEHSYNQDTQRELISFVKNRFHHWSLPSKEKNCLILFSLALAHYIAAQQVEIFEKSSLKLPVAHVFVSPCKYVLKTWWLTLSPISLIELAPSRLFTLPTRESNDLTSEYRK